MIYTAKRKFDLKPPKTKSQIYRSRHSKFAFVDEVLFGSQIFFYQYFKRLSLLVWVFYFVSQPYISNKNGTNCNKYLSDVCLANSIQTSA